MTRESVRKVPLATKPLPIDAAWRARQREGMVQKNLSLNALRRLVGCSLSHLAYVMSDDGGRSETPYRTAIERAIATAPARKGPPVRGGRPKKSPVALAAAVVAATPPPPERQPAPVPAVVTAVTPPPPGPVELPPAARVDELRRLLVAMIPFYSDRTIKRIHAAIQGDLDELDRS